MKKITARLYMPAIEHDKNYVEKSVDFEAVVKDLEGFKRIVKAQHSSIVHFDILTMETIQE